MASWRAMVTATTTAIRGDRWLGGRRRRGAWPVGAPRRNNCRVGDGSGHRARHSARVAGRHGARPRPAGAGRRGPPPLPVGGSTQVQTIRLSVVGGDLRLVTTRVQVSLRRAGALVS